MTEECIHIWVFHSTFGQCDLYGYYTASMYVCHKCGIMGYGDMEVQIN